MKFLQVLNTGSKNVKFKQQKTKKNVNSFFPKEIKTLQRATRDDYIYNGSFQEAVGTIMAIAQWFGVMPVIGIKSKSAYDLNFQWKSFRAIYAVFVIFGLAVMNVLNVYWNFTHSMEFANFVTIIFYASSLYATIFFIYLAQKWPKLMQAWEEVELNLPILKTQFEKQALSYKIKILSIVIICLSLIEHLLSVVTVTHSANNCAAIKDPIKAFFMSSLAPVFYVMEYSPWTALTGKFVNVLSTFTWSYMDLFVMIISIGLSSRFKLVNDYMMLHKGQIMPEEFWIKQRRNYRNLCDLLENIDNHIASITMLSFSNNLFFICVQLLNSMNDMPSFAHAFYFWFSLIYLIGRTLAVSLYSADINDESKRPIEIFRAVPRESWCLEIKRFSEEVTNDIIALSGMKFFHLTRKLVLSVAGTIITYELVLIQFHQDEDHSDTDPCFNNDMINNSLFTNKTLHNA